MVTGGLFSSPLLLLLSTPPVFTPGSLEIEECKSATMMEGEIVQLLSSVRPPPFVFSFIPFVRKCSVIPLMSLSCRAASTVTCMCVCVCVCGFERFKCHRLCCYIKCIHLSNLHVVLGRGCVWGCVKGTVIRCPTQRHNGETNPSIRTFFFFFSSLSVCAGACAHAYDRAPSHPLPPSTAASHR